MMGSNGVVADGDGFTPVKSADRTLELLEVLASSSGDRTLAELASELGIPKSSLHGLLRTMQRRGWIEAAPGGMAFRLGVRALLVGAAYVETDAQVLRTRDALDRLADLTGETVHHGRLDGSNVVYLAKRESQHPLRLFSAIGRRLPAHATALGKALLSERSEAEIRSRLPQPLARLTEHTITDLSTLLEDLEATRARGYAIDREENAQDIRCYGVALRTSSPATDAISISVPTFRLTERRADEITSALLAVQAELSPLGS